MSASALFAKNGDFYIPVTVQLAQIPRGDRTAAWLVYSALVDNLRPGQTVLGERFTDRVLRQSPWLHGYSYRFVQKGLHVLEQWGIIKRERGHGRRIITFTGRLRPSGKTARPEPKSPDKPKPKRTRTRTGQHAPDSRADRRRRQGPPAEVCPGPGRG